MSEWKLSDLVLKHNAGPCSHIARIFCLHICKLFISMCFQHDHVHIIFKECNKKNTKYVLLVLDF